MANQEQEESSEFDEQEYIIDDNNSQAEDEIDKQQGISKKFRSVDAYLAYEINENMFKMRGDKSVKPCKLLEPKIFKSEEDKLAARRFRSKDSASAVNSLETNKKMDDWCLSNSKLNEQCLNPTLEP